MDGLGRVMRVECGSTFLSRDGMNIWNACFFCSFYAGLLEANLDPLIDNENLKYEDFLEAGSWTKSFTGNMVDTNYHDENITRLANHFGVMIYLYTELYEGVTHTGIVNRYGNGGPMINIIKVLNSAHFNLMRWEDEAVLEDKEFFGAYEGLEKHIKKQKKQLEEDRKVALGLAERFRQEMKQELTDRKLARSLVSAKEAERLAEYRRVKQEDEDLKTALELAARFETEKQQIAFDRELARSLTV